MAPARAFPRPPCLRSCWPLVALAAATAVGALAAKAAWRVGGGDSAAGPSPPLPPLAPLSRASIPTAAAFPIYMPRPPAGTPGAPATRGRPLPPEDVGCAALRHRFIYYNRPPKTGSTSLRSALRSVARRCRLAEVPCHRHGGPNTVGLAGALQLAGCGAVMACHVADRPGVRAAVDRAAAGCPGGGVRLTSVRGLPGRDAAWLLQTRNAYANETGAVGEEDIRAGLADNAGDNLAAYFGLLHPPRTAVGGAGVGGAIRSSAPPPHLSTDAIADHLLWYDALVDLTGDTAGRAADLLSAVLGVRVAVAKENARTHGAFIDRVARVRNESRPGGAGGVFPDEAVYAVARDMYRHQLWFTTKGASFDELTDTFLE